MRCEDGGEDSKGLRDYELFYQVDDPFERHFVLPESLMEPSPRYWKNRDCELSVSLLFFFLLLHRCHDLSKHCLCCCGQSL